MRAPDWLWASLTLLLATGATTLALAASPAALSVAPRIVVEDVSATGRNDAWAVGSRDGLPAVLHWDGHGLTQVPLQVGVGELRGVSAIASDDVWAVGGLSQPRGSGFSPLVLHWNGAKWSALRSPNPGASGTELIGVRALSDHDVWAVGQQGEGPSPRAVILRWNGVRWSQPRVPSAVASALVGGPHAQGNGTNAVAPTSLGSAFAATTYLFLLPQGHGALFSGRTLRLRRGGWAQSGDFIGAPMFAVAAVSNRDAWTVGYYCRANRCPPFQPASAHWDGRHWRAVPISGPGDARLDHIAARSSHNVWATGTCTGSCSVLVLRWDGRRWARIPGPGSPITSLISISPVSLTEAWAIGTARGGTTALVHWRGGQWSRI